MGAVSNAAILAQDDIFRGRALAALVHQAREVATEDPTTPMHQDRARYANAVINNPTRYMDTVAWTIACDSSIASLGSTADDVPETTLLSAVLNGWNHLAGLYAQVTPTL